MATRLRGPLALALVIALLPLVWATRAAWTAPFRHTATHTSQPTPAAVADATANPTPRPTPRPAPLPAMLATDRFDLGAPRAYGRIDVAGASHYGDVDISGYKLAVTPPSMPSSLPVWKLRGFLPGADTAELIARLGIHPQATPVAGTMSDGSIDAAQASVAAGNGTFTTVISTDTQPASDTAAMSVASTVLADLGLFPQNADATASDATDMETPGWYVTYTRRPIDGVPVGYGLWGHDVASMAISQLGNVARFNVGNPSVDGGASYQLRSWRDAWSDVSRGHWFDECCVVNTGGGMMPASVFRADTVSLVYQPIGTPAAYLVPMYVFADSNLGISVDVPALRLADLAEPGGFRVTEPGAAP
jgi:hypothetical protein